MTQSGIQVTRLTKIYGRRPAFAGLSLDVAKGEFVALLGPSGAGKTTLLRCLVRLTDPEEGAMWVAGHPMHRLRHGELGAARRDIGFVFQQFNLVRRLSAENNAVAGLLASTPAWRAALGRFHSSDRELARQALARVGLTVQANQRADRLSGGQQQRVAIARALVQRSKVLLADEPIASLDPKTSQGILTLLRSLAHDDGLTILCSLHQHNLAYQYADRVVALQDLTASRTLVS